MQRGAAALVLLVAILLAAILGIIIYSISTSSESADTSKITKNTSRDIDNKSKCTKSIEFSHHFIDIPSIDSIIPPIWRNQRHTITSALLNISGRVPVYMPISGKINQGSYYLEEGAEFYLWDTEADCGITLRFDHITEPVDKIKALFPDTPKNDTRTDFFDSPLEMQAGELVGHTTGTVNAKNWNFGVYQEDEKNSLWKGEEAQGFVPEYTAVCPFGYYNESMAKEYEDLFIFSSNDIYVEDSLCAN